MCITKINDTYLLKHIELSVFNDLGENQIILIESVLSFS